MIAYIRKLLASYVQSWNINQGEHSRARTAAQAGLVCMGGTSMTPTSTNGVPCQTFIQRGGGSRQCLPEEI